MDPLVQDLQVGDENAGEDQGDQQPEGEAVAGEDQHQPGGLPASAPLSPTAATMPQNLQGPEPQPPQQLAPAGFTPGKGSLASVDQLLVSPGDSPGAQQLPAPSTARATVTLQAILESPPFSPLSSPTASSEEESDEDSDELEEQILSPRLVVLDPDNYLAAGRSFDREGVSLETHPPFSPALLTSYSLQAGRSRFQLPSPTPPSLEYVDASSSSTTSSFDPKGSKPKMPKRVRFQALLDFVDEDAVSVNSDSALVQQILTSGRLSKEDMEKYTPRYRRISSAMNLYS